MNEKNPILEQYEELKNLLLSIEQDLLKNLTGNKSAGIRIRKSLREVKKQAAELVKATIQAEKQ